VKRFLGVNVGVKPSWDTYRQRILDAVGDVPEGELVRADEQQPILRWRDGPGESTVADVVGEVTGWGWSLWQPEPDEEGSQVWLDRAFSVESLAVAIVRYRASHVVPYDSERDQSRADLRQILDTDRPQVSGYPLTDAMTARLLAEPDPDHPSLAEATTGADRLSRKLEALGYERLWNEAYATVQI
jgi:hypothetical protein